MAQNIWRRENQTREFIKPWMYVVGMTLFLYFLQVGGKPDTNAQAVNLPNNRPPQGPILPQTISPTSFEPGINQLNKKEGMLDILKSNTPWQNRQNLLGFSVKSIDGKEKIIKRLFYNPIKQNYSFELVDTMLGGTSVEAAANLSLLTKEPGYIRDFVQNHLTPPGKYSINLQENDPTMYKRVLEESAKIFFGVDTKYAALLRIEEKDGVGLTRPHADYIIERLSRYQLEIESNPSVNMSIRRAAQGSKAISLLLLKELKPNQFKDNRIPPPSSYEDLKAKSIIPDSSEKTRACAWSGSDITGVPNIIYTKCKDDPYSPENLDSQTAALVKRLLHEDIHSNIQTLSMNSDTAMRRDGDFTHPSMSLLTWIGSFATKLNGNLPDFSILSITSNLRHYGKTPKEALNIIANTASHGITKNNELLREHGDVQNNGFSTDDLEYLEKIMQEAGKQIELNVQDHPYLDSFIVTDSLQLSTPRGKKDSSK